MSNPLDELQEEIRRDRERIKQQQEAQGAPKKGIGFLQDLERSLEEGRMTNSADHLRQVTHKVVDIQVESTGGAMKARPSGPVSGVNDRERELPQMPMNLGNYRSSPALQIPSLNEAEQRAQMKKWIREDFQDLINEVVTERLLEMFSKEVIIKTIRELQAKKK